MEFNFELSALTMLVAVFFAIISTGVVDSKVVLGPDGLNIKSPPTQILVVFLAIFAMIL